VIRLLFENFRWKVFSLALAVVLWYTFVGTPELATSVSAPIEYQNLPINLEMVSNVPERVHLEVQGTSSRLDNLSGAAVVLNLAGVNAPGERTFTLDQHNVQLPFGVKLFRATPGQLRIEFESRVSREVPVRLRFSSPPPLGYHVVRQVVEPPTLRIVGPQSRVNAVEFAETDRIDLSQNLSGAGVRVNAFVRDPQVRFESPPVVQVKVTLERAQ
jgi:YbbR domain-containing protein